MFSPMFSPIPPTQPPPSPPKARPHADERLFIRCLYLVAALIALVAALSFHGISRLEDDARQAARSHERIALLRDMLAALDEAASAGLARALTGNAAPDPERRPERILERTFRRLAELAPNESDPAGRLAKVAALLGAHTTAPAPDLGPAGRWAPLADSTAPAIRQAVGDMLDAEQRALADRRGAAGRDSRRALMAVAAGALLSIGIAATAIVLIRRDFAGSRRAHAALVEANDLLDRRVAERTAALRAANARLELADAVFHNVQESIVITDLDFRILAVNPAFSRITEYSAADAIGRHLGQFQCGGEDQDACREMWQAVRAAGAWQGEIWSRRRNGDVYQEWLSVSAIRDGSGQPLYYIGVGVDLTRMQHAKSHLEFLAHHDPLTGLPNRLLLNSRLAHSIERARRDGTLCAVLFLDLDGFKPVNDTLGHAAGDELLKRAARRIGARLRDTDTLARLGGDEFVVVLEDLPDESVAAAVADSLVRQLEPPFDLDGGGAIQIGASIGVSLYPGHGAHPDALLRAADAALYAAKRAGKGTWRFAGGGLTAAHPAGIGISAD